jgi:hypothetical protein
LNQNLSIASNLGFSLTRDSTSRNSLTTLSPVLSANSDEELTDSE